MSGSGVQMPKWKSFTLPSWDQVHILREPPKSIHTRKKERVDMSNVNYMIRNDDSRINEGVSYLARGVNPMVDVMYNNVGGGGGGKTTSMPMIQASNPYKIMKDGAFRPPMFTQDDLLPLSRLRRPETTAITNPGIRSGFTIHDIDKVMDKDAVKTSIDKTRVNFFCRPTATFTIQTPQQVFIDHAINKDNLKTSASSVATGNANSDIARQMIETTPLQASKENFLISASPNVKLQGNNRRHEQIDLNNYVKDGIFVENITPNININFYNENTTNKSDIFTNIKDKLNYTVQSNMKSLADIKIQNHQKELERNLPLYSLGSGVKGHTKIERHDKQKELERNLPQYSLGSGVKGHTKIERHSVDPIMDDRIKTSANTSISGIVTKNNICVSEKDIKLKGMGSVGSQLVDFGNKPMMTKHNIPVLSDKSMELKRIAKQLM